MHVNLADGVDLHLTAAGVLPIHKLLSGLKLEFDAIICTLPCQNVTRLKQLNQYPTTKAASLFTSDQLTVARLTKANFVFNEMTLPYDVNKHNHDVVMMSLKRDLRTSVTL